MKQYLMKLFIAGDSSRSERAVKNLKQLCDKVMFDDYEIIIIDVLEQPNIAEEEKIIATPTLLKLNPYPQRRIIGDLSDSDKLLGILGVK